MNKPFIRTAKLVAICSMALVVAGGAVYAGTENGRGTVASLWSGGQGGGCPLVNVASAVGLFSGNRALAASEDGCSASKAAVAAADYPTCGAPKAAAVPADLPMCGAPKATAVAAGVPECCVGKDAAPAVFEGGQQGAVTLASLENCPDKADCDEKTACAEAVCPVTGAGVVTPSDLVAEAAKDGALHTFLLAAQVAGITDLLRSEASLTVFAPSNDAFAALDGDQFVALLGDSNRLRKVLMQHVVSGQICGESARSTEAVDSVAGSAIHLATLEGCSTLTANGASVVKSDLVASNGRLHVIDRVLIDETERLDMAVLVD